MAARDSAGGRRLDRCDLSKEPLPGRFVYIQVFVGVRDFWFVLPCALVVADFLGQHDLVVLSERLPYRMSWERAKGIQHITALVFDDFIKLLSDSGNASIKFVSLSVISLSWYKYLM